MAVVYEEALKKDIASKKVSGNYVLFGEDGYLKDLYENKLCATACERDDVFNFRKFTGKCDLQEIYDFALQFPIMADKKCIVIRDYDFEKADKTDFERICSIAEEYNETTLIIFVFDSIEFDHKKSSMAKKVIAAVEKSGGKAVILNHRRPAELAKMLCDGAAKRGCKMESSVAYYLIETVGEDILILTNELSKLCNFMGEGQISKQTVDSVCIKTPEASVYNLTEKIFSANPEEALKTVDELFFSRIEPMIILHTVSSTYLDIYKLYAAKKKGKTQRDVAEEFGYKNRAFVLERAAKYLNKLDKKKIYLSLEALKKADAALKSFNADERVIIEQLVVRLIYIIVKGESVD